MMKKYHLTLITRNQKNLSKAEKLAAHLKRNLAIPGEPGIEKYEKLENSYKIELFGEFSQEGDFISEAVKITDLIASPWLVYFDATEQEVSLILNDAQDLSYRRQEYNVIRWAHFQMT